MEILLALWNNFIMGPMINTLVLMYALFFENFGVSILVFTVIIRILTFPLTIKQIRMTKKMSEIQPLAMEIRQKYANDRQKQSQETMRLYKEKGVNPIGCLGPMFIQMPVWIGLYQAIIQTLPDHPERLASLSQKLYPVAPPRKRDHTSGQPLPVAGPGGAASLCPPGAGGNIHVGRPEDVHRPARGPQAGPDHPDDAVADANDAHVLLLLAAQRPLSLLGGIERNTNGDSILCCRLGEPAPRPPRRAKRPARAGPAGQGERRRWKQRWK